MVRWLGGTDNRIRSSSTSTSTSTFPSCCIVIIPSSFLHHPHLVHSVLCTGFCQSCRYPLWLHYGILMSGTWEQKAESRAERTWLRRWAVGWRRKACTYLCTVSTIKGARISTYQSPMHTYVHIRILSSIYYATPAIMHDAQRRKRADGWDTYVHKYINIYIYIYTHIQYHDLRDWEGVLCCVVLCCALRDLVDTVLDFFQGASCDVDEMISEI